MAAVTCAPCRWARNLLRWLDQGLNALAGGDPTQTVSSRLGRAEIAGAAWAAWACRAIGWVARDPRHCIDAVIAGDNAREVIDIDGPADGP